jgi:hypothetical protein
MSVPEQPEGLPSISRGLRSAERDDTPGGRPIPSASWRDASKASQFFAAPLAPFQGAFHWGALSGGVAPLNPRLMDGNPPD